MGRRGGGRGPRGLVVPMQARTPAEALFRSLSSVGYQEGTHAEWIARAVNEIETLANHVRTLTVDTFRKHMATIGVPEPADTRAYGLAFREAAKSGFIENSGRSVKGSKRENVGNPRTRPVTVWTSLL